MVGRPVRRDNEIVDPTGERQQRRRRTVQRFVVPALVVGTLIAAILGIALHSYEVNRNRALKLSREVLFALQSYVAEKVVAYLEPAVSTVSITNDILSHTDAAARPVVFAGYAASMLRQVPQIEAFYLANSNGDFALVRRTGGGGTEQRVIKAGPGGPVATTDQTDANGRVVNHTDLPEDDFDPRATVWFKGAVSGAGHQFWSAPYLFRPTGKPVVTVAVGRRTADGADHVAAVDVALDALSRFTSDIRIGTRGHALIVDGDGRLIASPELLGHAADPSDTRLDPSRDPVLARTWNEQRVMGMGARMVAVSGVRHVTVAAPIPGAPGWVLLLEAPERDFAGFAVIGSRQNLLFSLVLVSLAAVLAGLVVRQGLRADRAATLLASVRDRSREESAALGRLVRQRRLFDPGTEADALTEVLADLAGAKRATIWRISADGRTLACEDSYDTADEAHARGFALSRAELPRLFELLESGEAVEVADAARDPRTTELHRLSMRERGFRSLALLPIEGDGGTAGLVALEDANAFGHARNLAAAVAGIAALRLRALHDTAPDGEAAAAPGDVTEDPVSRSRSASLLDAPTLETGDGFTVYPAVSVMVLSFADPVVASRREAGSAVGVADEVARAVQDAGRRFEIPYLKMLGHTLVAAAGFVSGADAREAAIRLADAALSIRDVCLQSMERADLDAFFHVGLDVGRAVGRELGEPAVFNLWGDTVRMAELMASSSPEPGSVQVTEAAYLQLREHFLFRQRGRFYMPRVGVARTFVLAGRR